MMENVHWQFSPDKVVLVMDTANAGDVAFWRRYNPEAVRMVEEHRSKMAAAGQPLTTEAFVCQNYTCQAPTADPNKVKWLLAMPAGGGSSPQPVPWPSIGST